MTDGLVRKGHPRVFSIFDDDRNTFSSLAYMLIPSPLSRNLLFFTKKQKQTDSSVTSEVLATNHDAGLVTPHGRLLPSKNN